jgi:SAM-dependent methyltransferase
MVCPVCASIRLRDVRVPTGRALVRCRECGLLFAAGREAAAPARAWLTDDERRLEERVAARRRPQFARMLRAAGPPGRLLDVGAGVGEFVALARAQGWDATGTDVDPAVVGYAREHGRDVRLGELPALALATGWFDVVTLWNVLDFAPQPVLLLAECRRVLKPGGHVFVRLPNAPVQRGGARLARALAALSARARAGAAQRSLGIFHTSNFGARALRVALERAGFADIRLRNSAPIGGDPYLGFGRAGERAVDLGKRAVFAGAEALTLAARGRWLCGPSIEAWARRAG